MSIGAKIGLGVGIPVAVLVLALLAFFIIRDRKPKPVVNPPVYETGQMHHEMDAKYHLRDYHVSHELPANRTHELSTSPRHEMW
jgi:hypothetical protein